MTEVPRQLLADVLNALRGVMRPHEALLTVGRLLAWHALMISKALPAGLVPRSLAEGPTRQSLRDAFRDLSNERSLGSLRHAFDERMDAPYEAMSANSVAVISRTAEKLVTLDSATRKQLADAWADAWFSYPAPGFWSIPLEVADLAIRSVGVIAGQKVHCPGGTMDAVAIACMQQDCVPVGESTTPPVVAAIYAAIADKAMELDQAMFTLISEPTFGAEYRPLAEVKACVSVPRWGQRLSALKRLETASSRFRAKSSEALGLELIALGTAKEAVVIVPNGLLSGKGPDAELRQYLVENGPLTAVIGFPSNMLSGTSMPFSLLKLSRADSRDSVVFCKVDEQTHLTGQGTIRNRDRRLVGVDKILALLREPDGKLSRRVPRAEIAAKDFVLAPERYLSVSATSLADMGRQTAKLGDLVTIVKPQFLKPDEDPDGESVQEAIPSDMPEYGYLQRVDRIRTVEKKLLATRRQQVLEDNDVLLSNKGTIGKVGIAKPDRERPPLMPSQASVILRVKPSAPVLDPRFLVMYLRSPLVQQAIASFAVGGTIPNISLSDLKSLPVWVATPAEQQPFIEAFDRQAALAQEIAERSAVQQQIAYQVWVNARLATKE